jgi:hypothetical protein
MSADSHYVNDSFGPLVGRTILEVRPLTKTELTEMGWGYSRSRIGFVLLLDDGTSVIPLSDAEGNEPGSLMFRFWEERFESD